MASRVATCDEAGGPQPRRASIPTTFVAADEAVTVPTPAPTDLPSSVRNRILLYLGFLTLALGFGSPGGGLIGVPISFMLKNKLHLSAHDLSIFGLIVAVPSYLSFIQGYARDVWNPLGLRDRGFMVLFGFLTAAIYVFFAYAPVNEFSLGVAVMALGASSLFVSSAVVGLTAVAGRQHVMSGQVSAVWNIVGTVPTVLALLVGGSLSDVLEHRNSAVAVRLLFLTGAAIMGGIGVFALWRPRSVYDNIHAEHAPEFHPWTDLKRLLRHWPVYPALLIWSLWNFAPGAGVPLQYHMQNTLHANDAQWGQWNAIFAGSFVPTFMLYGFLCRKVKLGWLILWGTVVGVPQMTPLLLIHSASGALLAAAPIGLMGGLCTAAYYDLLIRSCPKGLEGTMLMLSGALYALISQAGNVLGATLYERFQNDGFHGFGICVLAITIVYALILPALLLVPRRLLSTPDGEAPPGGFDSNAR